MTIEQCLILFLLLSVVFLSWCLERHREDITELRMRVLQIQKSRQTSQEAFDTAIQRLQEEPANDE